MLYSCHVLLLSEIGVNNLSCRSCNRSNIFVSSHISACLFSHLQPLTPARRHVIRPAAKWSGASHNLLKFLGHSSATSGVPTGDPGSAPSTSRDAKASSGAVSVRPAIRTLTPVQSSTSGHTQPQPGSSSHALSQPKLHTNSQQTDGTSAHTKAEPHAVSIQTPSTSTNAKASANTSRASVPVLHQPQPSTSGLVQPQAGSSVHVTVEPQASTSTSATHYSCAVASSSSAKTQDRASTSTHSQDNPQASTSSAQSHTRTQAQPGTSTQLQSSGTTTLQPHLIQVKEVKLVVLPQQPSIQASTLVTQPQLQLRPQNLLQTVSLHRMQGNLIQIEPQPLAQAPAQPPAQVPQPPQVIPVIPPAVLIAAAPERLGPPEAGHRIILGSQAPGEAVPNPLPQAGVSGVVLPARSLHIRVPNMNLNPPAPPAPTASVPHNGGDARLVLAPAPNPERINPVPGVVAVPPAPEDIPRIEDARPGPSAPRGRAEQQPHVRALITGVVSITEAVHALVIRWLLSS